MLIVPTWNRRRTATLGGSVVGRGRPAGLESLTVAAACTPLSAAR